MPDAPPRPRGSASASANNDRKTAPPRTKRSHSTSDHHVARAKSHKFSDSVIAEMWKEIAVNAMNDKALVINAKALLLKACLICANVVNPAWACSVCPQSMCAECAWKHFYPIESHEDASTTHGERSAVNADKTCPNCRKKPDVHPSKASLFEPVASHTWSEPCPFSGCPFVATQLYTIEVCAKDSPPSLELVAADTTDVEVRAKSILDDHVATCPHRPARPCGEAVTITDVWEFHKHIGACTDCFGGFGARRTREMEQDRAAVVRLTVQDPFQRVCVAARHMSVRNFHLHATQCDACCGRAFKDLDGEVRFWRRQATRAEHAALARSPSPEPHDVTETSGYNSPTYSATSPSYAPTDPSHGAAMVPGEAEYDPESPPFDSDAPNEPYYGSATPRRSTGGYPRDSMSPVRRSHRGSISRSVSPTPSP